MPKQGEKKAKSNRKAPAVRDVTINLHKRLHGQYGRSYVNYLLFHIDTYSRTSVFVVSPSRKFLLLRYSCSILLHAMTRIIFYQFFLVAHVIGCSLYLIRVSLEPLSSSLALFNI